METKVMASELRQTWLEKSPLREVPKKPVKIDALRPPSREELLKGWPDPPNIENIYDRRASMQRRVEFGS